MLTSAKHAHVPSPKDAASLQRNGEVSNYFKGLLVLGKIWQPLACKEDLHRLHISDNRDLFACFSSSDSGGSLFLLSLRFGQGGTLKQPT
jgi:hypothetical protein